MAAAGEGGLEIGLDGGNAGGAVEVCSALEMVVKATVVEIYGADNSAKVIADNYLGVDKTGGIFVNFNT